MDNIFQFLSSREQLAAALLAIIAVVIGKFIEKFLKKDVEQLDKTLAVRKEVRDELTVLQDEVRTLREEADTWRAKYWEQVQLNTQYQTNLLQLQSELNDVKFEMQEYRRHNILLTEKLAKYFPDDEFHRGIHESTHPISGEHPIDITDTSE